MFFCHLVCIGKDGATIMNNEMWKDIPTYEGEYQASTADRIKSVERKAASRNWYTGRPFLRTVPERILKPGRCSRAGHLSVVLRRGSNGSPVHQLVMKTFVGESPKGMEVLHINGDPGDNRLLNLRYGTRTENILDVYYQGKCWRKLSIDDVFSIRFGFLCGFSGKEVSQEFGVSQQTISSIRHGRLYSWLK